MYKIYAKQTERFVQKCDHQKVINHGRVPPMRNWSYAKRTICAKLVFCKNHVQKWVGWNLYGLELIEWELIQVEIEWSRIVHGLEVMVFVKTT